MNKFALALFALSIPFVLKAALPPQVTANPKLKSFYDSSMRLKVDLPDHLGTAWCSATTITADGKMISAAHCTNGSAYTFDDHDGKSYSAKLIHTYKQGDVAIWQLDLGDNRDTYQWDFSFPFYHKVHSKITLPFTELGNSDDVKVGTTVIDLGSPYNMLVRPPVHLFFHWNEGTVTDLHQNAGYNGDTNNKHQDFIKFGSSIMPGDSGSGLVTPNGKLVGIVTMGDARYTFGLAVPINIITHEDPAFLQPSST